MGVTVHTDCKLGAIIMALNVKRFGGFGARPVPKFPIDSVCGGAPKRPTVLWRG
jgi:hypothetical protein